MSKPIEIECLCPQCQIKNFISLEKSDCNQCATPLLRHPTDLFLEKGTLDQCPVCGARHLYKQKDFNRRFGIVVLGVGIVLSPFTYGISLVAVTLLDYWLYKKVSEVGCCYQCLSVFRGNMEGLEPFNLQLHDYYRSLAPSPKSEYQVSE